MKKILLILGILAASFGLYAQSAEYTRYLNQAKTYETQKKWCHALGAYYDALATDDEPEVKQEAYNAYKELKDTILSGNPGKGTYNVFTIHDEWKKLLMDAEKYGSSIAKYDLTIGELELGDLNYVNRTASYSAKIKSSVSHRYYITVGIIKRGYAAAYQTDWETDLPKPEDWPLYSVSSKKDAVYNVGGALVFAKNKSVWREELAYYNAFEWAGKYLKDDDWKYICLYDYKFSIVDESGNEVARAKRFLLGAEGDSIFFEGITPAVMDLIDSGKAFVKPVGVYLEYGAYNRDDDKGGRSFIKNFPEVQLNLNNAVFYGKNQVGNSNAVNLIKISINEFVDIPEHACLFSTTEVTQEQYEAVMGQNPSYFVGDNNPVEHVSWYDAIYFCNKLSKIKGLDPVYSVNGKTDVTEWDYIPHEGNSIYGNVEQNLNANGYRLPTVEEWTYAAKGGQDFKYAGSDSLDEVGWYSSNSGETPHPVAQKKPNGYGLYDMSGNVWEWCWDSYCGGYRYYLGGGCSYNDNAHNCEVDDRDGSDAYYQDYCLGFRIVCSPSN